MRRIDEKYLITKRMERYQGPIYVQTEWPYICVKVMPYSRKSSREDARRAMIERAEKLGSIYCKVEGYRVYAYPVGAMAQFNEHRSEESVETTRKALNEVLDLFMDSLNATNKRKYEDWDGSPLSWVGTLYDEWKAEQTKMDCENEQEKEWP